MTDPDIMQRLEAAQRLRFEEWISSPPYEKELDRWPDDQVHFAWPGQYKDLSVELAWEAYKYAQEGV